LSVKKVGQRLRKNENVPEGDHAFATKEPEEMPDTYPFGL